MTYPLAQGHDTTESNPPFVIRPAADNVANWPAGSMFSNVQPLALRRGIHAYPIKHGGRLLAADEHPEVTEGQRDGDKVVLRAFPARETFTTRVTSPEYQEISKDPPGRS